MSVAPVVHVIEHHARPKPDAAVRHLAARGIEARIHRPCLGEPLPEIGPGCRGAMIMGGPQMVTDADRLPYLRAEQAFAAEALDRGLPLICICLGAQLLADRLGGAVGWHPEKKVAFGWHEVRPTAAPNNPIPPALMALSGNAQGFAKPPAAEALASADTWPEQAFRIGSAIALQFHPEVTREILDDWQRDLGDNIGRPGTTSVAEQDAGFVAHDPALKAWLRGLLDRWFDLT